MRSQLGHRELIVCSSLWATASFRLAMPSSPFSNIFLSQGSLSPCLSAVCEILRFLFLYHTEQFCVLCFFCPLPFTAIYSVTRRHFTPPPVFLSFQVHVIALNPYTCTMSEVSVTPVLCTVGQKLTSRWQNGELSQIYLVLKAACSADHTITIEVFNSQT